jgi:hypothetical protein
MDITLEYDHDKEGETGMKAHTEYLTMNAPGKMGFVNITPQVEECVLG